MTTLSYSWATWNISWYILSPLRASETLGTFFIFILLLQGESTFCSEETSPWHTSRWRRGRWWVWGKARRWWAQSPPYCSPPSRPRPLRPRQHLRSCCTSKMASPSPSLGTFHTLSPERVISPGTDSRLPGNRGSNGTAVEEPKSVLVEPEVAQLKLKCIMKPWWPTDQFHAVWFTQFRLTPPKEKMKWPK